MRRILTLVGLCLLLFLSGCASLLAPTYREEMQVKTDAYEPTISILGVPTPIGDKQGSGCYIRTIIDKKSHAVSNQIYTVMIYTTSGWRFYNAAYFLGGESAGVLEISRDFNIFSGVGVYKEIFAVELPDGYLEKHREGFSIKVDASKWEGVVLPISAKMVTDQLEAIEQNIGSR
ncbi:MAG: hypothetical protein CSA97_03575 [Bacteroidetes bacterium]|nr:MAG: hypothetical protein CSA97_03575 [Bacteroidota bacterium]